MPRLDRTTRAAMLGLVAVATLVGAGSGCRKPTPPPTDAPPEPQAATGALREAIAGPVERARAVEASVQAADEKRREAIDADAR